jgi:hypothetical protein
VKVSIQGGDDQALLAAVREDGRIARNVSTQRLPPPVLT